MFFFKDYILELNEVVINKKEEASNNLSKEGPKFLETILKREQYATIENIKSENVLNALGT